MILIIKINKEPLHDYEFVKPIENILKQNKIPYKIISYNSLNKKTLEKADKIIICGTSLKDNEFIKNLNKFSWIKDINKSLLGICGGHQIISLIFGAKLKKQTEIGFYFEEFKKSKEFLSLRGRQEVYHLHNNYTALPKEFKSYTKSKIPQAIKHNSKEVYGVLFHPEVRNKELIERFCNSH